MTGPLHDHAGLLRFTVDPGHTPEVRAALEEWLRPWRAGATGEGGLHVWFPAPEALAKGQKHRARSVLVRPRSGDLLGLDTGASAEERADVVLDVGDGEAPLHAVLGAWLRVFLAEEGARASREATRDGRAFERELKAALQKAQEDPDLRGRCRELFMRLVGTQEQLLGRADWEALEKDLETLAHRLDKKKHWRLLRPGQTSGKRMGTLFSLGRLRGVDVFAHYGAVSPGPEGILAAHLVVSSLSRQVRRWEEDDQERRPGALVQAAFQALPFPVLLLGEGGEVLQHNTAFVKLNLPPSKVARLKDQDPVPTRDGTWEVQRRDLGGGSPRSMYTFRARRQEGRPDFGGQDLGIITSSIAHELNNPLAGLLTALELMAMDPGWDPESMSELQEMRQGSLRCKQLVETFLGFSRPHAGTPVADKGLLWRCCEQALHLQRFRMVESGLRLQFTHSQKHPYGFPVHVPSMAMVFYLVLGEVMTAFHHVKLLEQRSAKGAVVEGVVEEDADRFHLRLAGTAPKQASFNSKLLQYLLRQERLQLVPQPNGILFLHQNVLL